MTQVNISEEVSRIENKVNTFYPARELPWLWQLENEELASYKDWAGYDLLEQARAEVLFACGYPEAIAILSKGKGAWEYNKMASKLGMEVNYGEIARGYLKLFSEISIYPEDTQKEQQNKEAWAKECLKKALEAVEIAEKLKQPEWKFLKAEIYRNINMREEAKKLYQEAYEERLPDGWKGVDILFRFHREEHPEIYGTKWDIIDKVGYEDHFLLKLVITFVLFIAFWPLALAFVAFWIYAKAKHKKRQKNPFVVDGISSLPEVPETFVSRTVSATDFPEYIYPSSPYSPKRYNFTYQAEVQDGWRYDAWKEKEVPIYRETTEFANVPYNRAMERYNRKKLEWYADMTEIVRKERIKNWEKLKKEAEMGVTEAQYLMTVFGFSMNGHNNGVPVFTNQEEYIMAGYNEILFWAPEK